MHPRLLPLPLFLACTPGPVVVPDPGPTPEVHLDLGAPWVVVTRDDDEIAVRLGDSAQGVRVWLRPHEGRVAGVSPVHRGRTLQADEGATTWPLVAFAYPDRAVLRVQITTQGPDLLVRAEGPPLSAVSTHPEAPSDPVLTWVRLRARPSDWRVVVDGLGTLSYPAGELVVRPGNHDGFAVTSRAGSLVGETDAVEILTRSSRRRWSLDTEPALHATEPYPRTAFTWTPAQTLSP